MLFIKPPYDNAKVKAMIVSKDAMNIANRNDANDPKQFYIT